MSGATVNRHYAVLDAARGFAALAVLLYHIRDLFGGLYILQGSFLAVDLFFLMSGLVISKAYDRKIKTGQLSISNFVWLRIIRLYPLYIIASSIGAIYFILKMAGHAPDAPSFTQMVMATLPAFFLAPSFGSSSWGFGAFPFALSAWSL
ncbi:MAG: acyltransferase, partial [Alphaproteobacteria bacterium]